MGSSKSLSHGPEKAVGVAETHGVASADGRVAQGLGEEALTDAGGPHQSASGGCSCLSRNSREKTGRQDLLSFITCRFTVIAILLWIAGVWHHGKTTGRYTAVV